MKTLRLCLLTSVIAVLFGMAFLAQEQAGIGTRMADAANAYLDSLTPEQKAKATFPFDSPERTRWFFVPRQDDKGQPTRKGLRLEEMNEKQKEAVLALLKTGTSESGYKQAIMIMSLEAILNELEKPNGKMVRNTGWYFVTIFGTPAKTGKWGWRIEGHHLSLNFTIVDGQVQSATPAFFGANPAEVKAGPKQGLRTLPEADDLPKALVKSLTDEQKTVALQNKPFPEIEANTSAKVGEPMGLAAEKMTDEQKQILRKLVQAYCQRMPNAIGDAQLKMVDDGGFDKIHFAYQGGLADGEKHTYRVQGPSFVIEFLNEQADSAGNQANHIHSAWRELPSDFGLARK
ncbi:MAG TPA: DUF3500 domain-containing protein [Gemmataceae bacterium]|jgi:hypothetical protein|nr:DUF3500 domain-containing protein [Gemmataceae bacterium]